MKKRRLDLNEMVANGEKIIYLTAYDYLTAKHEERTDSYTHELLLIDADMVGYSDDFCPKFVKKYANVGEELLKAFSAMPLKCAGISFPSTRNTPTRSVRKKTTSSLSAYSRGM